ncbi:MAG: sugar phosphate nucleotidyltransferase [Ignavibacteria bacterium]|jgi:glucose-1-phosphate thymidylyltransferase
MRAIIPVAGLGTRLKPHTHSIPKVLLNVGGKPILGHIIDKLIEEKIFKATFVVGHLGEMIVDYVKKEYPMVQSDFVEQKERLGLAHAIKVTGDTFDEDEIFIILGDTVFDVDLKNVFNNKKSSLGVKYVENPRRFGVAVLENDKVIKLVEKPKEQVSNLALVGLYYITNPTLLLQSIEELFEKDIKTKGEYQLTDALQIMIEKGEYISTFPVEGWYDCGKPETVLSTNRFLLTKKGSQKELSNVVINGPVFIAESAVIENSVIGPFTTIAEDCEIRECIIKNSIINQNSVVEKSTLEDSIIGSNALIRGNHKKLNAGDSSEIIFH